MKKMLLATLAICAAMTGFLSIRLSANAQPNKSTKPEGTLPKPNIVHIVADDLGWKDVGFNGATDIKTPNLDKLAAEGVKFTQFYVQPMCTPTRAALMTGRYPFVTVANGSDSVRLQLRTGHHRMAFAQSLKEAGYNTAIIGKWHLGRADKKYWPRQRGLTINMAR
jgi:arylsulfatase A-like enzyme